MLMDPEVTRLVVTHGEAEKLKSKLDDLFEEYLNLLDRYQAARQQLSTQLSSGFLSIAQANFASSSGRRIGQDYYDERMQALRTISITKKDNELEDFVMSCATVPDESEPLGEETTPTSTKDEDRGENEHSERLHLPSNDPIRWFGIFVPPSLRSAQAHFIKTVEGPIPQLVTLIREMRTVEIEIGRTRKFIKKLGNA